MHLRLITLLFLALSACGPSVAALTDAPEPLTAGGTDPLFTVTFRPEGFNVALLGVRANLAGREPTVLRCVGSSPSAAEWALVCSEPAMNVFDETTVGQAVTVELFAEHPQTRAWEYSLQRTTWTPLN
jgi:hypothetical protein